MKKIVLLSAFLFTFVSISYSAINDYWPGGWEASTGLDVMPGEAENVKYIPVGYSFKCVGIHDICYSINGPDLFINGSISVTGGGGDIYTTRK